MKLRILLPALALLLAAAPLPAQPATPRVTEWRGLSIPQALGRFRLADQKQDEEDGRPRLRLVFTDAEDEIVFVDLHAEDAAPCDSGCGAERVSGALARFKETIPQAIEAGRYEGFRITADSTLSATAGPWIAARRLTAEVDEMGTPYEGRLYFYALPGATVWAGSQYLPNARMRTRVDAAVDLLVRTLAGR
ncbi:MAG TPA: hypothetical protein VF665_07815 [Longimicrobium sp.]|jgi:hypothetical protein|uniref:hypothetical protein n=1 Tax=Longimicrobium sp. TaxID=2029185 RepID=UPI002EDB8EFF